LHDISSSYLPRTNHHVELEKEVLRALGTKDYRRAFALADRRCRILPLPPSHVRLLRAEALYHLGLPEAALESVAAVRELEPDDLVAARRMMVWGLGQDQFEAACTVASRENDLQLQKTALALIHAAGRNSFARVDVRDADITGWVVWHATGNARLTLQSGDHSQSIALTPDPSHPLATQSRLASSFRLPRTPSMELQNLRIEAGDDVIIDIPINPNQPAMGGGKERPRRGLAKEAAAARLSIIIPVYKNLAATEVCLRSTLDACEAMPNARIILVDDASPEVEVKRLLRSVAERANVTLLVNDRNLGFVGAVNRAIRETTDGDVLLLNADTVVPPGAIARLQAVLSSTPNIGTATPLTNNGEFMSFPAPNKSNVLPSIEQVELLDAAAGRVNAGAVVDVPSGIGFCMYMTRACLDVVPQLSVDFYRGYLEDVDFCLRAAEAGFRNVCIPSVFVGHAGSKSFLQDKQSLVIRNLKVLEQRYPRYAAECAAFVLADPLRGHRAALEQDVLRSWRQDQLRCILAGDGLAREIAEARARQLSALSIANLLIDFCVDGRCRLARLVAADGSLPQSLSFDLAQEPSRNAFFECLAGLNPQSLEIASPQTIPDEVISFIRAGSLPYDVLLTDAGLCAAPIEGTGVRPDWRSFVDGARAIVALDRAGADFATHYLGVTPRLETAKHARLAIRPSHNGKCLGILALRANAEEFQTISELAFRTAQTKDTEIVVLGQTLDDIRLMRFGHVHVTGQIGADEVDTVVQGYGINRLLLSLADPVFGHPLVQRLEDTKLPFATVDWRGAEASGRKSDLMLSPALSRDEQIDGVMNWLTAGTRRRSRGQG
jgi:GT2 family glycosyltransferase